ncbi:hypothetical protein V6Z11_D02G221000 [Gossypium hirsutum]
MTHKAQQNTRFCSLVPFSRTHGIVETDGSCLLRRSHIEGISRLWLFAYLFVGAPNKELSSRLSFPNSQIFAVRFCKWYLQNFLSYVYLKGSIPGIHRSVHMETLFPLPILQLSP